MAVRRQLACGGVMHAVAHHHCAEQRRPPGSPPFGRRAMRGGAGFLGGQRLSDVIRHCKDLVRRVGQSAELVPHGAPAAAAGSFLSGEPLYPLKSGTLRVTNLVTEFVIDVELGLHCTRRWHLQGGFSQRRFQLQATTSSSCKLPGSMLGSPEPARLAF